MHEKLLFPLFCDIIREKLKLQQGGNDHGNLFESRKFDFQEVLNSKIYVDKSE